MRDLTQTIRNAISGMFTANITEEVVKRIVQTIEGDDCIDEEAGIKAGKEQKLQTYENGRRRKRKGRGI